ncbi:unnamed protein product [Lampetra fluviatilis]
MIAMFRPSGLGSRARDWLTPSPLASATTTDRRFHTTATAAAAARRWHEALTHADRPRPRVKHHGEFSTPRETPSARADRIGVAARGLSAKIYHR